MSKRSNGLPQYCSYFLDRHKKPRVRFRKKGFSTYLPYPPYGEEFEKAYCLALKGLSEHNKNIGKERTMKDSFSALCVAYYRSVGFADLASSTKTTYRGVIERFREEHGNKNIKYLKREHIKTIISKMSNKKQAANRLLSILKIMLDLAVEDGWIESNPARSIKGFSKKTQGYHSWTDEEMVTYVKRHPSGSKARLAFALLFYTAQRRSDVIRMGWQHINADNSLEIRQQKTSKPLILPIHRDLQKELDTVAKGNMTFLITEYGRPFSAAGFGNWFRERCREAGLNHCSAHGLRKALARSLAESGVSADMIKAVTGHSNLKEVSIYTNAADQKKLAEIGINTIRGIEQEQTLSNQDKKLDKREGK